MHRSLVTEVIDHDRRALLGSAVKGIAIAGTAGLFPFHRALAEPNGAIRPSASMFPRRRWLTFAGASRHTRWPDRETVDDRSQGLQLAKFSELVRYWGTGYDWRKAEAKLNALPQFIDRHRRHRHPLHSRPLAHANALPLIMTHGWPGSVFELLKIVGPLTDPTPTADAQKTHSISFCRRCPASAFPASRPSTGWGPDASHEPGPS